MPKVDTRLFSSMCYGHRGYSTNLQQKLSDDKDARWKYIGNYWEEREQREAQYKQKLR